MNINKLKQIRNATKKKRTTQGKVTLKDGRWVLMPTHKQMMTEFGVRVL